MTITNDIRREIMQIAWGFFRTDRHEGFGCALKRAWAWIKRTLARPDRIVRQVKAGASHIRVTNLVRRCDRRQRGKDEVRWQAMYGS